MPSTCECWKLCSWPLNTARTPPLRKSATSVLHAIGVVMVRAGAVRRMMTERNPPARRRRSARARAHSAETASGSDARTDGRTGRNLLWTCRCTRTRRRRRSGIDRTTPARARLGLTTSSPANRSRQKEVVHDLIAIVVVLGLAAVVIADARIHRHPIDHVAIRLEVREEPIVVFVAGLADRDPEEAPSRVDVVARRQNEADVLALGAARAASRPRSAGAGPVEAS